MLKVLPEPLSPVQFFAISWDCPYAAILEKRPQHRVPSTSALSGESPVAEVYAAWNEDAILFLVAYAMGTRDLVVDLFFDTRDLKSRKTLSTFCHHFQFASGPGGIYFGVECASVRSGDAHSLANSEDVDVVCEEEGLEAVLRIKIPSWCLRGYDPFLFPRLGFTYRIGRGGQFVQHFSALSDEYAIEQNPSVWGSIDFVGGRK